MEPKHAAMSADIKGLKLRLLSHSRSEYPIILAIKVTKHTSISPPAKYAKQAHATPTIGATIELVEIAALLVFLCTWTSLP